MNLAKPEYVENCKCEEVLPGVYSHVRDTSRTMFHLMEAKRGIGLAAPQVGTPLRFFIIKNMVGPGYSLFINPEIIWKSKHMSSCKEGCLTYNTPLEKPTWYVKRHKSIIASWTNYRGNRIEKKMSGLTAQVFQHENDHLDAITIKNKNS